MPTIDLAQGKVHYTATGMGPPLVLLHANPGDSRDFDAVAPALARSHRVIALDWPGYGASPAPAEPAAVSLRFYHETLVQFLAALQLSKVDLLGNSVGGYVAARYAAEHPDAVGSIVLVAPGGFTPHGPLTRAFCRLQGSRYSLPPKVFASLYLRRRTPVTADMLARAKGPQSAPAPRAINRALWRGFAGADGDLRERAGAIRARALLIFGAFDPAISARKDGRVAATAIPGAETCVMSCGHAPFAEVPAAFVEKVLSFLDAPAQAPSATP